MLDDKKMTNLELLLKNGKSLREIVGRTSVWNYHRSNRLDNLAKKRWTNLGKFVEELKKKGEKGGFTMFVSQIGRTGHSASKVVIIRGITNHDEIGSMYYTKRIGEVFIK